MPAHLVYPYGLIVARPREGLRTRFTVNGDFERARDNISATLKRWGHRPRTAKVGEREIAVWVE